MNLDLKALKPNPMRDFRVDPIDASNVEELRRSIKEDGFWGGVVARKMKDGTYQIACGHHRVEAALKAGIRSADIFVLDRDNADDGTMVRVYARENATQRGNTSAAAAGSVAAAIRFIVRALLVGDREALSQFCEGAQSIEKTRESLSSKQGLGEPTITEFLAKGMPTSFTQTTVREHLASLKMSGDYARIVGEVSAQIEVENAEAIRALERIKKERAKAEEAEAKAEAERKAANERAKAARDEAEKKRAREAQLNAEANAKLAEKRRAEFEREAAEIRKGAGVRAVEAAVSAATAAGGREVTFDLEGVTKHLKREDHVRVFRTCVTGAGIAPYLKVSQQAALAKALVAEAAKVKQELSGAFIRETITDMVLRVKSKERQFSKAEEQALRNRDFQSKWDGALDDFARNVRGIAAAGVVILDLMKKRPKDVPLRITGEFKAALKTANDYVNKLNREF